MLKLKIDNQVVEVEDGKTIMDAAAKLGIDIPNMCFLKGHSNHPSCMICVVKDIDSGELHPSCAVEAKEGMEIVTMDDDIFKARQETLELLLSDHVGECEARCRVACPAFMDIPLMNRLIAENKPIEALKIVKEEIALPIILGYVCSAPCENACRRNSVDETIAICQLKKYVALQDAKASTIYMPEKKRANGRSVAIIGAGSTGMTAAFHLTKSGFDTTVYDRRDKAGGTLLDPDQPKEMPLEALQTEVDILMEFGVKFQLDKNIDQEQFESLKSEHDYVVIATGSFQPERDQDFGFELNSRANGFSTTDKNFATTDPKVFVVGSAVSKIKMAVRAVAHGKALAFYIESLVNEGEGKSIKRLFNSKFSKLKEDEISEYLKEAPEGPQLSMEDDLKGYNWEDAIKEAERCLRCDCRKPESCKLRIYSDQYDASQDIYKFGERKLVTKEFNHDTIVYEEEKCIRCSLCVDIVEKEGELIGLTHLGRGFDVRIGIPFNESLNAALKNTALKVALHCPTAALSKKIIEERELVKLLKGK